MYALYDVSESPDVRHYRLREEASLFGCNSGYVPWLLSMQVEPPTSEPLKWHVEISDALSKVEHPDQTLVINLKPNSASPNLSLYELLDVWGYSASGWTPVLLRLRGLFVDEDPSQFDKNNFRRRTADCDEPIFSMMYLRGTILNGALEGRWTPPGPSPTNSALLWPEAFEFFWKAARPYIENAS